MGILKLGVKEGVAHSLEILAMELVVLDLRLALVRHDAAGTLAYNVLQEGSLSNLDPRHRAGVDESEVSVVNRGVSEPLLRVGAEHLVAYDPLGGTKVREEVQGDICGSQVGDGGGVRVGHIARIQTVDSFGRLQVGGLAVGLPDVLEHGAHEVSVSRGVSGRHFEMLIGLNGLGGDEDGGWKTVGGNSHSSNPTAAWDEFPSVEV